MGQMQQPEGAPVEGFMAITYRKNSTMPSLAGMPFGYKQPIFFERDDVSSIRFTVLILDESLRADIPDFLQPA